MPDGNGSALETAVVTKAVVANCVVLVPALAVGAAGVPVKVGLAIFALADKSTVAKLSVPLPLVWIT